MFSMPHGVVSHAYKVEHAVSCIDRLACRATLCLLVRQFCQPFLFPGSFVVLGSWWRVPADCADSERDAFSRVVGNGEGRARTAHRRSRIVRRQGNTQQLAVENRTCSGTGFRAVGASVTATEVSKREAFGTFRGPGARRELCKPSLVSIGSGLALAPDHNRSLH